MTADPVAILRGVFTAIAALLTALAVSFTAGTSDAPDDTTVAISEMSPAGDSTPVCAPSAPASTSVVASAESTGTAATDTGPVQEDSSAQAETATPACLPGTQSPAPTPTPEPSTPAPAATPTPTAQVAATQTAAPPPADDVAIRQANCEKAIKDGNAKAWHPEFYPKTNRTGWCEGVGDPADDVAIRQANCEKAIKDGNAKAWHPEFYPKTNRTGWCEGVAAATDSAPAPPAPKPADPRPSATPPPPPAPTVDDRHVASVLKDKYTEVLKSYCSFKLSHTRESDVGGGNPRYTGHDFPGPCRYKTEADLNVQGGGTRVSTWRESFAATKVQQLADNLDILGLENLAHEWRVEVKRSAWQTQSNVGGGEGKRNPVLKMGAPFGEPGANDVQSEYWGNISGANGATEPNLLEQRWRLFADTFSEVINAPAINGQPKPTIGEYLGPKNPKNCAVNGRALIPGAGCG